MAGLNTHRHAAQPSRDPCRQGGVSVKNIGALAADQTDLLRKRSYFKRPVLPARDESDAARQRHKAVDQTASLGQDDDIVKPLRIATANRIIQQRSRAADVGVGQNVHDLDFSHDKFPSLMVLLIVSVMAVRFIHNAKARGNPRALGLLFDYSSPGRLGISGNEARISSLFSTSLFSTSSYIRS